MYITSVRLVHHPQAKANCIVTAALRVMVRLYILGIINFYWVWQALSSRYSTRPPRYPLLDMANVPRPTSSIITKLSNVFNHHKAHKRIRTYCSCSNKYLEASYTRDAASHQPEPWLDALSGTIGP